MLSINETDLGTPLPIQVSKRVKLMIDGPDACLPTSVASTGIPRT